MPLGTGTTVRLYAGELGGAVGPAPMPTPVLVAHVQLDPGGQVTLPVPRGWTAAFTVVAGSVEAAGQAMKPGDTPVFADDGEHVTVSSTSGGQVLLMCGEPIAEPIATGGGFVMNTSAEIDQAFADLAAGRFGHLAPSQP